MPILNGQTLTVMQLSDAQRKLGITPLPTGGAINTVLTKASGANYDVVWAPPAAAVAGNGIVVVGNTVHFAQAAAYTTGAIPFASGVATMGFDAANLLWNNANKYLEVGGYSSFGTMAAVNTTFALFGASTASISSQRIPRGSAAYTGTVEGDLWNDYSQKCLIGYVDGMKQFDVRACFIQTGKRTVTDSVNELTLFGAGIGSLTFPANFFVVGKTIRVTMRGYHTMDATPPSYTFRVKLGGVTYVTSVYTDRNDTDRYMEITFFLTCRTAGAGGTAIGDGCILMGEVDGASHIADLIDLVMTGTAALDTTVANTLDITAQANVAEATSYLVVSAATVEVIG